MTTHSLRLVLLACCFAPLLAPVSALAADASPCGPGMSGEAKSIVHYSPGPDINKVAELMPKHLAFLQAQMAKGAIQYAGPIVAGGAPTGSAVLVYHSADADAVRATVLTDPMVIAKVFTYELSTWLECKSGQ